MADRRVVFRSREASPVVYEIGLPLIEALLTAVGGGVVFGVIRRAFGAGLLEAAVNGAWWFLILAAVLLLVRFGRAVLWGVESLTNRDLDGDRRIGRPGPESEPRFVFVKRGAGRRLSEADDLADFVRGCYTKGTGRRAWVGSKLATTGHTVTRGRFDRWGGILLKAGILEDNGKAGRVLTCELDEALSLLGFD